MQHVLVELAQLVGIALNELDVVVQLLDLV
jgi:hypothetical protein